MKTMMICILVAALTLFAAGIFFSRTPAADPTRTPGEKVDRAIEQVEKCSLFNKR